MTKPITIELTETQEAHLQAEAERFELSVEALVERLVVQQLEYDARFRQAVEQARAAIERGDSLSQEEVVARARRRAEQLLAERPET